MEKVIFSADIHGNIQQYQKILNHAQKEQVDIVVFGGDLTPKDPERRTPAKQREFLKKELFPLLAKFREESNVHILFIMGNDDFKSNHDVMVDGQDLYGYRMIDQIPYISKSGYIFIGYTSVPFTPFKYKCWEKRDLAQDADVGDRDDVRREGVISLGSDLKPYSLKEVFSKPSIAEDLAVLTKEIKKEKMILVSHAPPYGTVCDFNRENKHVGSRAIRDFVEKEQPYASLHGHIHETVDLAGQFMEKLGRTFCIAVGNDNRPDTPYVIEVVLGDKPKFKRLKL